MNLSKSRTKNVSRNATVAIICQIVQLALQFIIRTVFISVLGAEYLGVNGLFTNVLTILSFAELGIGNAIVFSMYKPLAINDREKIKSLMSLYKKAYTIIGIVIACVGLGCIPFLEYIIKDKPNIPENISLLYILFLANTVVSYFFAHKKNMIIADQKNYIILLITQIIGIIKTAVQVVFLYLTHQYIIFLLFQIIFTIIENVACTIIANRLYPFLKGHTDPLNKNESKRIFENVKALTLYKFGSVILNGTDNILISAFISVRDVGLASNYVLLITSCSSILQKVIDVFTSSVGNLNATEGTEKQYDIFKKLLFLTSWLFGYASIGLAVVGQQFIRAWIGDNYLLSNVVLLALVAEFYIRGIHSASYIYRTTLGFFVEGRWSAIAAAIINLVLSIVLCQYYGLAGIFIATPISRIFSVGIVDPVLIYRKGFKKNVTEYYLTCFLYIALFSGLGILCHQLFNIIKVDGWFGVIVQIIIVTILFNTVVILVFFRTKMFKEIIYMLLNVLQRKEKVKQE